MIMYLNQKILNKYIKVKHSEIELINGLTEIELKIKIQQLNESKKIIK